MNLRQAASPASEAVMSAQHPPHAEGGPCDDCAFRSGTSANQTRHTVDLAKLCVEGFRPFYCHQHPGLCRGYVAALNLRGVPQDDSDRSWSECARLAADALAMCIELAKAETEAER